MHRYTIPGTDIACGATRIVFARGDGFGGRRHAHGDDRSVNSVPARVFLAVHVLTLRFGGDQTAFNPSAPMTASCMRCLKQGTMVPDTLGMRPAISCAERAAVATRASQRLHVIIFCPADDSVRDLITRFRILFPYALAMFRYSVSGTDMASCDSSYPALQRSCTINWILPWSPDATTRVAPSSSYLFATQCPVLTEVTQLSGCACSFGAVLSIGQHRSRYPRQVFDQECGVWCLVMTGTEQMSEEGVICEVWP